MWLEEQQKIDQLRHSKCWYCIEHIYHKQVGKAELG